MVAAFSRWFPWSPVLVCIAKALLEKHNAIRRFGVELPLIIVMFDILNLSFLFSYALPYLHYIFTMTFKTRFPLSSLTLPAMSNACGILSSDSYLCVINSSTGGSRGFLLDSISITLG